ncbi:MULTISPECIES: helix-turn-helix domain-containing protein, partial [Klebsiella pneumoniae complex]
MKAFNGERLKEARYFRSYSITELSSILGVSKQMVSKYENGKSE